MKKRVLLIPLGMVFLLLNSSQAQSVSGGSASSGSGSASSGHAIDAKIGRRTNVVTVPYGISIKKNQLLGSAAFMNVKAYPNPTTEATTLEVSTNLSAYTVQMFNLLGQEVTPNELANLTITYNLVPISLATLQKGKYYIKVSSTDKTVSKVTEVFKSE